MDKSEKITAGIIVAAGKTAKRNEWQPLSKIGSITAVKRIVLTFQQAGVSPIVVITGYDAREIEYDLADYGVIFLYNPEYETTQMFDSAKVGLNFLQNKCHQILFSPVNIPMFTPETILRMIESGAKIISPSYHKKAGHPLLIASELIPKILEYDGNFGMRGAIENIGIKRQLLEIEDEGVIHDLDDIDRLDQLLKKHNQHILHPFVRISIEKEYPFFNSRTKLLLLLIQDTHSVRSACNHIALSYSKAWNMLNELEQELGYAVVERKHGGTNGGKTFLTKEGIDFLNKYQQFEQRVRQFANDEFYRLF